MSIAHRQDEVIAAAVDPEKYGVTFFTSILEKEKDPLCKWYALKAIGDIKGLEAKKQLLEVLKHKDHQFEESSLHRICAWAIGQIGPVLCEDVISILKNTTTEENRIAAIDALGEIADCVAIPVLSKELVSGDISVKVWAALALAKIGEKSLSALSSAIKTADDKLIFIIVDALSIIGTEKTIPVLIEAWEKSPHVVEKYFLTSSIERKDTYAGAIKHSNLLVDKDDLLFILERANSKNC